MEKEEIIVYVIDERTHLDALWAGTKLSEDDYEAVLQMELTPQEQELYERVYDLHPVTAAVTRTYKHPTGAKRYVTDIPTGKLLQHDLGAGIRPTRIVEEPDTHEEKEMKPFEFCEYLENEAKYKEENEGRKALDYDEFKDLLGLKSLMGVDIEAYIDTYNMTEIRIREYTDNSEGPVRLVSMDYYDYYRLKEDVKDGVEPHRNEDSLFSATPKEYYLMESLYALEED